MNILRVITCGALGAIAATVLSWAGLYLFGSLALHGSGSLFDANPTAADAFFSAWLAISVVSAVVGGYLGHVSSRK